MFLRLVVRAGGGRGRLEEAFSGRARRKESPSPAFAGSCWNSRRFSVTGDPRDHLETLGSACRVRRDGAGIRGSRGGGVSRSCSWPSRGSHVSWLSQRACAFPVFRESKRLKDFFAPIAKWPFAFSGSG